MSLYLKTEGCTRYSRHHHFGKKFFVNIIGIAKFKIVTPFFFNSFYEAADRKDKKHTVQISRSTQNESHIL